MINSKLKKSATTDKSGNTPRVSSKKLKDIYTTKTESTSEKSIKSTKTNKSKSNELPINVTINSPRKSKNDKRLNSLTDSDTSNSNDRLRSSILNRGDNVPRKRNDTRTLHEDEIKMLKFDIDNSKEMAKLKAQIKNENPVAKSKAFYVDLKESASIKAKPVKSSLKATNNQRAAIKVAKTNSDVKKATSTSRAAKTEESSAKLVDNKSDTSILKTAIEPISNSDDNYSYEDDFESYESDFDSYHTDSSSKSRRSDSDARLTDDVDTKDDSISENEDDVTSERRGYGATEVGEEKMLDSGSYELREAQRSAAMSSKTNRMKDIDEIIEVTDEGFSEGHQKNSFDSFERPRFIDFNRYNIMKQRHEMRQRIAQRHADLLKVIRLHEVTLSLFELKPMSYDVFMTVHSRGNTAQCSTQTYEDSEDMEIQTEPIATRNAWTQLPVKFSHEQFRADVPHVTGDIETDFNDFGTPSAATADDADISCNELWIYMEQRCGSGFDERKRSSDFEALFKCPTYDFGGLVKFLKRVEKPIRRILNCGSSGVIEGGASIYDFCQGSKVLEHDLDAVRELTCIGMVVSSDLSLCLTGHNSETTNSGMDNPPCRLCLWDLESDARRPVKVCLAIDRIVVFDFVGDSDGMVTAALTDGCVYAWDMSQTTISSHCVYTSCCRDEIIYGSAVDIKISGFKIYLLYEHGTVTIWTIVQTSKSKDVDPGTAIWSQKTLNLSSYINLYNYIENQSSDNQEYRKFNVTQARKRIAMRRDVRKRSSRSSDSEFYDDCLKKKKSAPITEILENGLICTGIVVCGDWFLVSRNSGEVLQCVREAGVIKIRRFTVCECSSSVTCITVAPRALPYFLAGTNSGSVHLYSMQEMRCLLTLDMTNVRPDMSNTRSDLTNYRTGLQIDIGETLFGGRAIKRLIWREDDVCGFIALSGRGIGYWDLCLSDIYVRSYFECASDGVMAIGYGVRGTSHVLVMLKTSGNIELHKMLPTSKLADDGNVTILQRYVSLV